MTNSLKKIPLTQGRFAVVDADDYAAVAKFKWCALKIGRGVYAARSVRTPAGKQRTLYLHAFLLPQAVAVDHIDGNSLNNSRANLREATKQQNTWAFKRRPRGKTPRFRGVFKRKDAKSWRAQIGVSGKTRYLGSFATAVEAARAYDTAAVIAYGAFAQTNFPSTPL